MIDRPPELTIGMITREALRVLEESFRFCGWIKTASPAELEEMAQLRRAEVRAWRKVRKGKLDIETAWALGEARRAKMKS